MEAWRLALIDARKRLGLGRDRLAAMAGVSSAIIRAYEAGRREPTRATLDAIIGALRLDRVEANAIRESAGFARDRTALSMLPNYFFERHELASVVEASPWPQFATDDAFVFAAVNRAALSLWGLECSPEPGEHTLLSLFSEPAMAGKLMNFDDLLRTMLGQFKAIRSFEASHARPSQSFVERVERYAPRNPAILARLTELWPEVAPVEVKARWEYDVIWRGDAPMRFHAVVSMANEREALAFHDWIPRDGATWRALSPAA